MHASPFCFLLLEMEKVPRCAKKKKKTKKNRKTNKGEDKTNPHIHKYIQTQKDTNTHKHTHTHSQTHTDIHIYADRNAHTNTQTHEGTHKQNTRHWAAMISARVRWSLAHWLPLFATGDSQGPARTSTDKRFSSLMSVACLVRRTYLVCQTSCSR